MPIPTDPAAAQTIATLASIQQQLSDAVDRLADASARSVRLADQTDWRTDAATVFHSTADRWRRDVANLSGTVECARDDVARVRGRVETNAWRSGV